MVSREVKGVSCAKDRVQVVSSTDALHFVGTWQLLVSSVMLW